MLNIIAAEAWASDAVWNWFSAQRAVNEAITALEDAGAALLPLVAESEWHAEGAAALHELILELRARAASEAGELSSRLWEIEAMAAS